MLIACASVSHGAKALSRCVGRGCDEALSVKKGVFSEKGGGNSVNEGFGKDFYRKGNSVKRSGPFSVNCRTLKIEKLLSSSPSRKSALTITRCQNLGCTSSLHILMARDSALAVQTGRFEVIALWTFVALHEDKGSKASQRQHRRKV